VTGRFVSASAAGLVEAERRWKVLTGIVVKILAVWNVLDTHD
jgi:hypothetical protein